MFQSNFKHNFFLKHFPKFHNSSSNREKTANNSTEANSLFRKTSLMLVWTYALHMQYKSLQKENNTEKVLNK